MSVDGCPATAPNGETHNYLESCCESECDGVAHCSGIDIEMSSYSYVWTGVVTADCSCGTHVPVTRDMSERMSPSVCDFHGTKLSRHVNDGRMHCPVS